MIQVRAEGVGVRFQFDRQRRVVTPTLGRLRRRGVTTWGLQGVDLRIEAGEGVALVGASGAGKTTMLRLLASVLRPDVGRLTIRGRVAALLSIEAGLQELLTGRENANLLGVLGGLSRVRVKELIDDVSELSGLGSAFERPVSSYSQGMRARLGYAVALQSDPDILLLDEVHEAFDHEYRELVEGHVEELRRRGGIVVATGHDHDMLARLCDRGLFLHGGRLVDSGPLPDVVDGYLSTT